MSRPKEPELWDKACDYLKSIPSELRGFVLGLAVGKGKKRFQAAAWLAASCATDESAGLDDWIAAGLTHSDEAWSGGIIQVVGQSKLKRFAPIIAQIISSESENRWWAVMAAGELRDERCLPALLELTDKYAKEDIPYSIVHSLAEFDSPLVTLHLRRVFATAEEDRDRVRAAWGLGRQNHQQAIAYLVEKLDDDQIDSESGRAAQALSDLFGWEFEWAPGAEKIAKENWRRKQANEKR